MADLQQAKSRTGKSAKKGVRGEDDFLGERDRNLALDQILQKQIAADWARSEAREETVSCHCNSSHRPAGLPSPPAGLTKLFTTNPTRSS